MMNFGYEVKTVSGVKMIEFSDAFIGDDSPLKKVMKYEDFKSLLTSKGYSIIEENGLYYKILKGDKSGIEYAEEVDALIDCFIHAQDTGIEL